MLGLKLRSEFVGQQMPGTAITLRTSDSQGATQKPANEILSITYPTADIQCALKAISTKRSRKPIVLMGDRGRGKSHIMAVMHHAIQAPELVENWAKDWDEKLGGGDLLATEIERNFYAITEPVHNHEYPYLWELIFDRHPKGQYYKGQFEQIGQPYPPRTLIEKMFEDRPTCLILDEFQTWISGLPETDPKTGYKLRQWAFNFVQNLSEIAKDRPDILVLVISVLDNRNDAFHQVQRQGPTLIDFRGPTAKIDRQRLLLHRLFENRDNIADSEIDQLVTVYANERFRLFHSDKSDSERDRVRREVIDVWPFGPELIKLLEDQILLSEAAQETRDLIRILAYVFRSRGNVVPVITPSDFMVDGDSDEVQSLVDAIAAQASQEKLRQIAQRNLQAINDARVDVPNARELISAIWMRSMSPNRLAGGTPADLHLDITRHQPIDDNAFQAELTQLLDNCVNIHGEEVAGGPLRFGLEENPRARIRASAKNDKLWQIGAVSTGGQASYPGKDIEHIRNTISHIFASDTRQPPSQIIVLGPDWETDPWSEVAETDKPPLWTGPVLVVLPEQLITDSSDANARLGNWLVKHVKARRNTIRFLLLGGGCESLFGDLELVFMARCSFLCSGKGWGNNVTYKSLHQEFDRPFRTVLKSRYTRFAILRQWDFQQPANCVFEIDRLSSQGQELPAEVEDRILKNLFDPTEYRKYIISRAKDGDFVGSVMDDLIEPPPPSSEPMLPYIGETKLYEQILQIAASGAIVLNVDGNWVSRRVEDNTDEEALRFIRSKAFRSGQEMRKIRLALPGAIGGAAINAPPVSVTPIPGTSSGQPITDSTGPDTSSLFDNSSQTATQVQGQDQNTGDPGNGSGGISPVPPAYVTKRKKSEAPAIGVNLVGCFEDWGIRSDQAVDVARIEFVGLTAQQIKRILQGIPSAYKAQIEIEWKEEE